MNLMDTESKIRGFALIDPMTGLPFFIREKIVNLTKSFLDGARITILKNSLDRIVDKRDKFLFPMEKLVPISYVLRIG